MFNDIVLPDGNEEALAAMASTLGYRNLAFAYTSGRYEKAQPEALALPEGLDACKLMLAFSSRDVFMFRRKHHSVRNSVICCSRDEVRELVEKAKPGMVFGIEASRRKDFIYHKNSGMNHVIAKLASENDVVIGISFRMILDSDNKARASLFSRLSQNIRLCRKYKAKMKVFSFASHPLDMRSPYELLSLCVELGMHPAEAKKALMLALKP